MQRVDASATLERWVKEAESILLGQDTQLSPSFLHETKALNGIFDKARFALERINARFVPGSRTTDMYADKGARTVEVHADLSKFLLTYTQTEMVGFTGEKLSTNKPQMPVEHGNAWLKFAIEPARSRSLRPPTHHSLPTPAMFAVRRPSSRCANGT